MSVYADEYGYFFNSSGGDRTYAAESFENWLKPFFTTGVFQGSLQVTAQDTPDMSVRVSSGFANLEGKACRFSNDSSLVISTASGAYDRIDTIVVRRDNTERTISLEVVTGETGTDPQPTAPVQNADIWEIVLAEVFVGVGVTEITGAVITDKRMDTDVCGYVVCPVDTFDFGQFATQFDAYLAEFKAGSVADWTTWATAEKAAFEAWEAQEKSDYNTWEAGRTTAFNTWFAGIQDILDEDTAGHLLNMINQTRDGILTQTQGKETEYNGNIVTDTWDDGHHCITTYNGNTTIEQMYDHNDTLLWTKTTTYNGNKVREVIS